MSSNRAIVWQPIDDPMPAGAEWFGSVRADGDGNLHVDLAQIRKVGLADLSQVVEYRIAAAVGSVSHHVRFHNGGEVWFVLNDRSELVDLEGWGVSVIVSPEGDCRFGAFEPLTGQNQPAV